MAERLIKVEETQPMGPVTRYLVEDVLTKKLRKYGVVVWYDPAQAFRSLVDRLSIERARVLRYSGSYYRLRHDAEDVFKRLDRSSVAVEEGLIIYVNAAPLPKNSDVLLGLEKAGTRFDWSLAAVARDALKEQVPRTTLDTWLSNNALQLEDLDRMAGGEVLSQAAAISLVFGTTAANHVALRFLIEPDLAAEITNKGALQELKSFFSTTLGLAIEEATSIEGLRKRLGRHILMTEFVSDLPPGTKISELANVPVAEKESQIDICRNVARELRDRWSNRNEYITLARTVETEFNLRSLKIDPVLLRKSTTFPFEEEIALRSLEDLSSRGEIQAALDLVDQRRGSFWTIVDPIRAVQWRTAETALRLCVEADRVMEELKGTKGSPASLARSYAQGEEGHGRWYLLDSLERGLEWLITSAEREFEHSGLLRLARGKYSQAARALADRFQRAIRTEGFVFETALQQTDVFAKIVRPAMQSGVVAYLVVSGLRYEMAVELLDSLSIAEKSELRPVIATPPALPVLGLAALLPGAEGGITLREKSGNLAAEVDGNTLQDTSDRVQFLTRRLGADTVIDLPFGDLLTKRLDTIRKKIEGKRLLVVRGHNVEGLSIEARALQMRKLMADLLSEIRRGIRRLRDLGVSNVVLASSHGCLLSWGLSDSTVEPPDGHMVAFTSRAWAGRGGGTRPEFLRFRPSELGLGGELDIVVPTGLGLFKSSTEPSPYVYGGISLQELVVPVATIMIAAAVPVQTEDQFDLVMGREQVTNRLFTVTIRYHRGSLLSAESRRVRVVARSGKGEIGRAATAVHGFDQATGEIQLAAGQENHVTIMLSSDARQGVLVVAIVDPDTEVALSQSAELSYDLTI